MHNWGQRWTRYKRDQNPNKNRVLGTKGGYYTCTFTLHKAPPKGRADQLSHPLAPDLCPPSPAVRNQLKPPLREKAQEAVTCCCFVLLQQEPQWRLAWISCLASYQFLLIKEAKNPGQEHTDHPKTWYQHNRYQNATDQMEGSLNIFRDVPPSASLCLQRYMVISSKEKSQEKRMNTRLSSHSKKINIQNSADVYGAS